MLNQIYYFITKNSNYLKAKRFTVLSKNRKYTLLLNNKKSEMISFICKKKIFQKLKIKYSTFFLNYLLVFTSALIIYLLTTKSFTGSDLLVRKYHLHLLVRNIIQIY